MSRILVPNTKKEYSIFEEYGKSLLKKYIKMFQKGGQIFNTCVKGRDIVYPCEIGGATNEHHNEPIQPLLIKDGTDTVRVFKIRTADNEIRLMTLFEKINIELQESNIMNERLGVVNIISYIFEHEGTSYDGSSWEFIDGQKIEENIEPNSVLDNNLHLLEAVSKLIGLTDLHGDNILIRDNIPYCIDSEVFNISLNDSHKTGLGAGEGNMVVYNTDNTRIHKFMEKLLRNKKIYNLIHNFRQNLDNFRVLMGSTTDYAMYAGYYRDYNNNYRNKNNKYEFFKKLHKKLRKEPDDDLTIINRNNNLIFNTFIKEKQEFEPLMNWLHEVNGEWYSYAKRVLNKKYTKDTEYQQFTKTDNVNGLMSLRDTIDEFLTQNTKSAKEIQQLKRNYNNSKKQIEGIISKRLMVDLKANFTVKKVIDVINKTIEKTSYREGGYVPIYMYRNGQLFIPYSILDDDMTVEVCLGKVKSPDSVFIPEVIQKKLERLPQPESESSL